jgi:hypothetical protein
MVWLVQQVRHSVVLVAAGVVVSLVLPQETVVLEVQ